MVSCLNYDKDISLMRDFGTYFSPGIPCACVPVLVFECVVCVRVLLTMKSVC